MSRLNVDVIAGAGGTAVQLLSGASGDGSRLTLAPNILAFSPQILQSGVDIDTNISFTFSTNIEFSGTPGTIQLRSGSASGPVIESYTTGSSGRLSIVGGNTLTIDPTSSLVNDTTYFVILPSVGIANTLGVPYPGSSTYQFRTEAIQFSMTGGTHEFTRVDPASPTGYYKYHVFTGTSPFTLSGPSASAVDLQYVLVAGGGAGGTGYSPTYTGGGGGGAGGVLSGTGPTMGLTGPKTYTVTLGAGGPSLPPSGSPSPSYNGGDSTITSPTGTHMSAIGGGVGGGYPGPTYGDGTAGGSGGGGGGQPSPTYQSSYPTRGYLSYFGGSGTPGQGNPGGRGSFGYTPTYGIYWVGGGGGGANGAGSNASYPSTLGPNWPTMPTSTAWNATGGNGGPGRPLSTFGGSKLVGFTPTIPSDILLNPNYIGPSGYFGGGGGGGSPSTVPYTRAGDGGNGGGGHGAYVQTNNPQNPSPFQYTGPTQYHAESGSQFTGGGGGGGVSPNPSYATGAGGSGVFMVRYATALS